MTNFAMALDSVSDGADERPVTVESSVVTVVASMGEVDDVEELLDLPVVENS